MSNNNWINNKAGNKSQLRLTPWEANRVINKCPAIMFAANRTDSVKGRIMLLTVSIQTINIISNIGVPWGTKWANIWLV